MDLVSKLEWVPFVGPWMNDADRSPKLRSFINFELNMAAVGMTVGLVWGAINGANRHTNIGGAMNESREIFSESRDFILRSFGVWGKGPHAVVETAVNLLVVYEAEAGAEVGGAIGYPFGMLGRAFGNVIEHKPVDAMNAEPKVDRPATVARIAPRKLHA